MSIKKYLAVAVILLFLNVSVIPSTGSLIEKSTPLSFDGKTLYVGGDGPENYSRIQDAIDNASDGDTVFVYNGTYYENIVINKTINLIGENRNSTVIDAGGSGDVVRINADWVNISRFTITNSGPDKYDAGVDMRGNHTTIKYNNISNSGDGIVDLYYSRNNNISNNIINSNDRIGIHIRTYGNNIIKNNIITNHGKYGIDLAMARNNSIIENNISNNEEGIQLHTSSNNIIINNTINSNNYTGIVIIWNAQNNLISGNNIRNTNCGIFSIHYSDNNIINNNNISSNKVYGIYFDESSNNTIKCNTISMNNEVGIRLGMMESSTIIYHNNFIKNTQNAYDEGNNTWDDGYPFGGNYWDDYNGTDTDGDGIGDTPYNISGGDNQDLYPLMHPFELYYILNISAPSQVDEGTDFSVTVKSTGGTIIPGALVEFRHQVIVTDFNGIAQFTTPMVENDTLFWINATKEGYTGDSEAILVKDEMILFSIAFVYGRLTNLTTTGEIITFDAVNIRVMTFFPYTFNTYTSGEKITLSKYHLGFVGTKFIFVLCGVSI